MATETLPMCLPEDEPSPPAADPWWAAFGRGVVGAASAVGRGFSSAFHAVDPDVRRDLAQMPVLAMTLLLPGWRAPIARPDDGRRPLIFVHGLGGHRGNFLALHGFLYAGGRRRMYSVGFPHGGSIEEQAGELGHFVREVIAVNELAGDAQVDIVAHSMGGLIARACVDDLELARRVARLVTLGSPHGGTHAARWAGTRHTSDLRPDSALMERLRRQEPWSRAPELICFWSDADPFMQPASTARVAGADNRLLEGMSHIDYLLRPAAWKAVQEALR